MRIALAQMDIHAGDITYNLNSMKRMIDEAVIDKADLIIFPEMCVSGYLIGDRFLQAETIEYLSLVNLTIMQWSIDIGIIWGNIYSDKTIKNNRDGRFNRFNAAYFAYQGQWVKKENHSYEGVYFKHCLPDYRFFDDSRYFKSGVDLALEKQVTRDTYISPFIFEKNQIKYRIGLEICEDLWSKDYVVNPTAIYSHLDVDFIVNISSSPWTMNKEISRQKRIQEHVDALQNLMVPLIYVNACGMQNTGKNVLMFDGDSAIYNNKGIPTIECNDGFKEELLIVDQNESHLIKHSTDKLRLALIEGIRQFDHQVLNSKMTWIIGMSGGIDSCVNTVLLVTALGKDRVIGYNMASQFNQTKTINVAHQLAKELGIEYHEGSIEKLVASTQTNFNQYEKHAILEGLIYENIQARIRGHLL
ncbi:MAG: nitrilase-related carbon-nitrogen hydrolase, partial [Erysipelotrichaceae bacterium]